MAKEFSSATIASLTEERLRRQPSFKNAHTTSPSSSSTSPKKPPSQTIPIVSLCSEPQRAGAFKKFLKSFSRWGEPSTTEIRLGTSGADTKTSGA